MSRKQRSITSTDLTGAAYLILLATILLWPVSPITAQSQTAQKPPVQTKAEIISTAAAIVRASTKLSRIWSGYWPEDQAFIINVAETGALLISPGPKPDSFAPVPNDELPPELRNKAFFHEGVLDGAQRPFVIDHPIGQGRNAILVNAQDREATTTTTLILHEQFHGYQGPAFKGREEQFVGPLAVANRVDFAAAAEVERSILMAAVTAQGDEERRRLIQQYFAVRRERERTVSSEVVKVEQGFERIEGTASYADKAGLVAISGGGEGELKRLLIEQLSRPLTRKGTAFTTVWFRTRNYGTGAALTYLISRTGPESWRTRIESGAKPDELLEASVGTGSRRQAARLAKAARERFGYEAKRRELEPVIRAGEKAEIKSIPEFLKLGAYHVVFDPGPAGEGASPGFRATNMVDLDEATLALPQARVFNVAGVSFSLTARDRPVLLEENRYSVLLPATPKIAGSDNLAPGEHRFERLLMSAEGYELKVDAPVVVRVEPNRMVIRMDMAPPSSPEPRAS